jgi:hypothetical protein
MNRYFIFLIAVFTFGTAIASEEIAKRESCARCHWIEDGEMTELGATFKSIKGIVDGTIEHNTQPKLTDEEIQSLVDYFSTFKPAKGAE